MVDWDQIRFDRLGEKRAYLSLLSRLPFGPLSVGILTLFRVTAVGVGLGLLEDVGTRIDDLLHRGAVRFRAGIHFAAE